MIRYNEKKHCFEVVSVEEHMQERFRAYETLWKKAAEQNTTKELTVEGAKNEGRKEVWDMVRRLYLADEVENAYDLADLADLQKAFGTVTFSEILLEDVHEVLAKDKERLKRIEGEKIIRPGDEVKYKDCATDVTFKGFVLGVNDSGIRILRLSSNNFPVINYWDKASCKKTGNHNPDIAKVMEALKEVSDGAKNS